LTRHPGRHAAMMFELVLGEGGCYPGNADFFTALMTRLRREGIAVIVDEVQTFGRTWQPFAFQHFGLDDMVDIVSIGKMTQVCATLFRGDFNPTPELISQTFTGSTAAILAAVAILEHLLKGGYFGPNGRNAAFQHHIHEKLAHFAQRHPGKINGPFGLGAMVAFTPFDGSREMARALVETMFDEGLISFQAGHDPVRIRFLPPVAALDNQTTDAALAILERSIQRVAASHTGE
jgi:4-aminobutyrate aminotransferase-like enzyme